MTKESWYNLNAWRYNSEYAAHMYGWMALKSVAEGSALYSFTDSSRHAEVTNKIDWRLKSLLPTIFFGMLGI